MDKLHKITILKLQIAAPTLLDLPDHTTCKKEGVDQGMLCPAK